MTPRPRSVTPPVALTIAGSDSGGGAGIQADLRTFAALGVHGTTAVTAVTAQNSTEVRVVQALDPGLVAAQVRAVLDDLAPGAAKTGMLATAGIVDVVAELAGRLPALVVDPVLVSSTGHRLLHPDAERRYREVLIPRATVLTPNVREAARLLGTEIRTLAAQHEAARALQALGAAWVVVTGGCPTDGAGTDAVDVVADGRRTVELRARRIDTPNTHGSGCTFSAAIAAELARGASVPAAIRAAKAFVHRAVAGAAAWRLGAGHGPLDHLGWNRPEEDEEP